MILLGIESSCDETAAAVIRGDEVLASVVSTQLVHQEWGGVVPELASREHLRVIQPVVEKALHEAGVDHSQLDALAATRGPGLLGSLLVGYHYAKGLALALELPFLAVNHMEGHIYANFSDELQPELPALVLVVSGGHTQLVLMRAPREYQIVGETIDDAVGECFDKVSQLLGLGYPGGPAISRAAATGDSQAVEFPIALRGRQGFDFSFSGLKTAVLNYLRSIGEEERLERQADICASFQAAAIAALVRQTKRAVRHYEARTLILAGGVAANGLLRQELTKLYHADSGVSLHLPELAYCTDNAVMIARAAHGRLARGERSELNLDATPRMRLGEERG